MKDASSSLDTIKTWETTWPHSNWAVACGRTSGILVIDIDQRKGGYESLDDFESRREDGVLPTTLTAISGGGGRHLIFEYPTDGPTIGNRTNWLPGVDVRSDGGYIILPPSSHISGGTYQWIDETLAPVPAPTDLLQSLQRRGTDQSSRPELIPTKDILKGVPEGERDDTLFRACCRWRRQLGDDSRDAVVLLAYEAARNCDPPFPDDQAVKKVDQAFKQDHSDDASFTQWAYKATNGEFLHHFTDLGNALRLIDAYGDDLRHVPEWGWLQWTDIGWQMVGLAHVIQLCMTVPDMIREEAKKVDKDKDPLFLKKAVRHSMSSESAGSITAMERLARSDPRVLLPVESFDNQDHLLACRNGILDLKTKILRPFTRDDLMTKNTNVIYDPNVDQTQWLNFLSSTTDGDVEIMEYLQMAAGYTLTGSNAEECFFIITGPQRSGKSTFNDAIMCAMGSYATTAQTDTFMYRRGRETPKDELARLAGMRMTAVSEIREGEGFNEALIKQFTGGDRVTARFLYRDTFEFVPRFKLWIATNHEPLSNDDAMQRRIKLISFPRTIPADQADPRIKAMVRDPEVGGRAVLAWAVEGAYKWYQAGRLPEPYSVTMAVSAYQSTHDTFTQFMNEHVIAAPGSIVRVRDIHIVYNSWAHSASERQLGRALFTKKMRERGHKLVKYDDGNEYFENIKVKPVEITVGGMSWG